MFTAASIAAGLLGQVIVDALAQALGLRAAPANLPLVVALFAAQRRGPVAMAMVAAALGYLVGRAASAPDGVVPFAFVSVAVAAFAASGSLSGGGRGYFVAAAGVASLALDAVVWALAYLLGDGGPSGQGGAIVLRAASTALLAGLLQPALGRLEARLAPSRRGGLRWR